MDFFYLSYDREKPNGLYLMRRKILDSISSEIKFIDINMFNLKKLETKNERIIYLKSLGVNFL